MAKEKNNILIGAVRGVAYWLIGRCLFSIARILREYAGQGKSSRPVKTIPPTVERENQDGQNAELRERWLEHVLSMVPASQANGIVAAIHHLVWCYKLDEIPEAEWPGVLRFHLDDITGGKPRHWDQQLFRKVYNDTVRMLMALTRGQFDTLMQTCYEWLLSQPDLYIFAGDHDELQANTQGSEFNDGR